MEEGYVVDKCGANLMIMHCNLLFTALNLSTGTGRYRAVGGTVTNSRYGKCTIFMNVIFWSE